MKRKVVHLLDDVTPGGVTISLDHLMSIPALSRGWCHDVHVLRRGSLAAPHLAADVIVSHLAIKWANLPMLTALRALNPGVPIVHVEHSYTEAYVAAHAVPRRRFSTLMRVAFSMFDRVVAVSAAQADWMIRRGFAPADRFAVLNPARDLGRHLALAPRLDGGASVFGLIGRLHVQKGFDLAIQAFRRAAPADAGLRVFGEGPERARLEALAGGDPRIAFEGWVEDSAIALAGCDAVLMPSRWEAFGIVAQEAQAAGRPLAVAALDGMAGHVRNGALGVGDNTVQGWEEAIRTLAAAGMPAERVLRARAAARAALPETAARWMAMLDALTGSPTPAAIAA